MSTEGNQGTTLSLHGTNLQFVAPNSTESHSLEVLAPKFLSTVMAVSSFLNWPTKEANQKKASDKTQQKYLSRNDMASGTSVLGFMPLHWKRELVKCILVEAAVAVLREHNASQMSATMHAHFQVVATNNYAALDWPTKEAEQEKDSGKNL